MKMTAATTAMLVARSMMMGMMGKMKKNMLITKNSIMKGDDEDSDDEEEDGDSDKCDCYGE